MSETVATPAAVDAAATEVSEAQVNEQTSGEQSKQAPPKQDEFKPIKLKLKLDKKEEEMEFDYDKLTRTVQKGIVADRRFEEAARKEQELRKRELELQDKFSQLSDKQSLKKALQELGVDHVQLAEELMTEYLEEQTMTQEQRRIRELEMFKQQKEREEQELIERFKAQQEEQELRQHYTEVDHEIAESLERHGIEKNLATAARVLNYLLAAEAHGIKISVDDVVEKLAEEWETNSKGHLSKKTPEQLAKLLGEDQLVAINNWFLKRRTGGAKAAVSIAPRQAKQAPVDPYLFFKNLGR